MTQRWIKELKRKGSYMSLQEFSAECWKTQIEACATTNLRDMVSGLSEGVAAKLKANDQSIVKLAKDILQTARTSTPLDPSLSDIKLSILEPTRNVLEGLSLVAEGFFNTARPTTPPHATTYQEAFEEIQKALVSEGVDKAREMFKSVAKKILQKEISAEPFANLGLKPPAIDFLVREWATALDMVSGHFREEEESE